MPLTFGGELNYQTEKIVFDVVDLPLPYNGILGRPALAKFVTASHYAYITLKMPGPLGVLTIPSDEKDAIICVDKMYRDTSRQRPRRQQFPPRRAKGRNMIVGPLEKSSGSVPPPSARHPLTTCQSVPSKRSKVAAPQVKKVLVGLAGVDGTFTISTTLNDK